MNEYLSFKKLITPVFIQGFFWVAVAVCTITALFDSGGFWAGLLQLLFGPIVIRIFCESLIVVFEINETLTEIRDIQRAQSTPSPTIITTPPAV